MNAGILWESKKTDNFSNIPSKIAKKGQKTNTEDSFRDNLATLNNEQQQAVILLRNATLFAK